MAVLASEAEHAAYFTRQLAENVEWARRMDMDFDRVFRPGVTVLDFGCGHGALSAQAARAGAEVTGIDTNRSRIDFARRYVPQYFPLAAVTTDFICGSIEDLPGHNLFDAIVSKDTFEHAAAVDSVLAACRRLLRPGGRIYTGFSPLWYSPFGDHGFLTRRRFPWAQLLLGSRRFLAAHNAHTGRPDRSVAEAGFNRWRPADFEAAFRRGGFRVEKRRINAAAMPKKLAFLPLDLARRAAPLEAFATIGMYVTLRRI